MTSGSRLAAVTAVVHTAIDHWLDAPRGTSLRATLARAFDLIAVLENRGTHKRITETGSS
ncbi:hypothetical protein [Allorhizocola rhizosphaerae]|uniref:hypothetical protein n=1 Tax=Allorhizocola rhizosphaerae TaxID=1872709 RepID=UPI000E3BF656|nr:hypothetical protein [Allorhizocola rhizosphaerae]